MESEEDFNLIIDNVMDYNNSALYKAFNFSILHLNGRSFKNDINALELSSFSLITAKDPSSPVSFIPRQELQFGYCVYYMTIVI